ncbi:hypothetical protein LCGC14_1122830 [marine sediment metagenome]|uniref:Uncharacterized protein n=1 Tax=marine sediment metagenome TaxID=412755 RepID=A0A0F9MRB5_9ZZZZ
MQMIFGSSAAPVADIDVLNLSGTAESPRMVTQDSTPIAQAEWLVGVKQVTATSIEKGQIQSAGYASVPSYSSFDTSTDWVIPNDFDVNYYIRATYESGSSPTAGSGLGSWLSLVPEGAARSWKWRRSSPGSITGVIKLEIATDLAGTDIVATGYYGATVIVAD